jgi:hypothetical protein
MQPVINLRDRNTVRRVLRATHRLLRDPAMRQLQGFAIAGVAGSSESEGGSPLALLVLVDQN